MPTTYPRPSIRPALFVAAATVAVAASIAGAGSDAMIEVIYSNIPFHPTAVVTGAQDLSGNPIPAEFVSIDLMGFHPDGSEWVIKGRNSLGLDLQAMLVRGTGATGAVFAQEGQPVDGGAPGELYNFFGLSAPSYNDLGQIAFIANARGGDSSRANKAMFFDGTAFHVVRQQGDAALGLIDNPPENSGDEVFGTMFGSIHLLNDGTIGVLDRIVVNIDNSRRQALFYDDTASKQIGVTPIDGGTWKEFEGNHFWTTPDGSTTMIKGKDDQPVVRDQIIVVNGEVVLRANTHLSGSWWVIETIFNGRLHPCGDVFSHGSREDPGDWAARNAELIADTGGPTGDGAEELGDRFISVASNCQGDWVMAASTDAADPATNHVIIYTAHDATGPVVVMREGDMVDLNGDGLPNDDAFIGRGDPTRLPFREELLHLTDDGDVYVIAYLRDGAGFDLVAGGAQAFLRLDLSPCPADIDGNGAVDVVDILALLVAWGPCGGCPEDIDDSGAVDIVDLLAVLSAWGQC